MEIDVHRRTYTTAEDRAPWRFVCVCGWRTTVRDIRGPHAQTVEAQRRYREHTMGVLGDPNVRIGG